MVLSVRLVAWMGWIVAVPFIVLAWLTYFHPGLRPVFIAALAAAAVGMTALFVRARHHGTSADK